MMSGYVRLHRSLIGHAAFRNDAEAMAFAWMVIRAAWKPSRVRYKERAILLDRGQLAISQRDMGRALDRDKAWIERLWKRLKSEAMIQVGTEAGVAVITISNYSKYQDKKAEREALDEAPDEAGARQAQGTEQGIEEGKKEEGSVADATGADAPKAPSAIDLKAAVFSSGTALLVAAGSKERAARSMIGRWCSDHGAAATLDALAAATAQAVPDPIPWIQKRFANGRLHPTGGVGADPLLAAYRDALAEERAAGGQADDFGAGFALPPDEPERLGSAHH